MSKDSIYICDRCKKEARAYHSGWTSIESSETSTKTYDLCRECKALFYDFMSGLSVGKIC